MRRSGRRGQGWGRTKQQRTKSVRGLTGNSSLGGAGGLHPLILPDLGESWGFLSCYASGSARPFAFASAALAAHAPSTSSLCGRIGQWPSLLPASSQ